MNYLLNGFDGRFDQGSVEHLDHFTDEPILLDRSHCAIHALSSVTLRHCCRRITGDFFEFDRQLQRPAEMLDKRLLKLCLLYTSRCV